MAKTNPWMFWEFLPVSPLWAETACADYSGRTLHCSQMRRSLFMRMWLSSSFNKLTTSEILSSCYIPERGASLRFACSKVILHCDTPTAHLCMQRCNFNEGLELNILPVSSKFTLTWLLLRHEMWLWSFMCWSRGMHGITYCKSHISKLNQNKCRRKKPFQSKRVWL